jgi:hypothetical protein
MNKYMLVHANGEVDKIEGDFMEVNEKTGQIVIYKDGCLRTIVAAAPSTTFARRIEPQPSESKVQE